MEIFFPATKILNVVMASVDTKHHYLEILPVDELYNHVAVFDAASYTHIQVLVTGIDSNTKLLNSRRKRA